jgi:hypothetical protein
MRVNELDRSFKKYRSFYEFNRNFEKLWDSYRVFKLLSKKRACFFRQKLEKK